MKKNPLLRKAILAVLTGIIITVSIAAYLFFKPHRNVQATETFAEFSVKELTDEFTANEASANAKYLANDGNSKVLIIKGRVNKISVNQNGEKVIELKDSSAKVGVSASFPKSASPVLDQVQKGYIVKIKGAITAGNAYDSSLDLYNNSILIQCKLIK